MQPCLKLCCDNCLLETFLQHFTVFTCIKRNKNKELGQTLGVSDPALDKALLAPVSFLR